MDSVVRYEYSGYNSIDRYIITPSNIENKNKFPVDLYVIPSALITNELDFNSLYMSYLGIFGNTPKYYPLSINNDEKKVRLNYQLDKNNNITSASWNMENNDEMNMNFKFSY